MTSRLTFTGDLFFSDTFIGSALKDFNLIINYEGSITNMSRPALGKVILEMKPVSLQTLFLINPIAVNIANNHIMDFGVDGLERTFQELKKQNIPFFGAGSEEMNVNNPLIIEFEFFKIALLGYVKIDIDPNYVTPNLPGVRYPSREIIKKDIEKCVNLKADRIIVCLHWGVEEVYLPKPEDIELAHFVIDQGADLIIGHHSHCIQPWEIYKEKYIFYGLGNLFFSNLNLQAFYNDSGESLKQYLKKHKYWNRESLLVHFDPFSKNCKIQKATFDQEKIILKGIIKNKYRLKMGFRKAYRLSFGLSYYYGKLRKVIYSLCENPMMLLHRKTYVSYYQTWKRYKMKA